MWKIIDIINDELKGAPVPLTTSCFQSNSWDFSEAAMEAMSVTFSKYVPENKHCIPLEFMTRMVSYYLCRGYGRMDYAAMTLGPSIRSARTLLFWLADKNILIGQPEEYIKPASTLTPDDFKEFFTQ